jgi:peptidoglycan-associated lipoprotein
MNKIKLLSQANDMTNIALQNIKLLKASALVAVLLAACLGCSSKKGLGSGGGESLNPDGSLTYQDENNLSEYDLATQQESRYGDGSIPTAEGGGMFRDIFFDYDSSTLSSEAQQDLQANASILKNNPNVAIVLEGHCDARGTNDYNMALGEYRAKSVRDTLTALGIPSQQVQIISYGENIPLDPSESEYSYAQNRRVHFAPQGSNTQQRARYNNSDAY